jgi:hypothetical protein
MVITRWPRTMVVGSLEVTLILGLLPSGKLSQSPNINFILG